MSESPRTTDAMRFSLLTTYEKDFIEKERFSMDIDSLMKTTRLYTRLRLFAQHEFANTGYGDVYNFQPITECYEALRDYISRLFIARSASEKSDAFRAACINLKGSRAYIFDRLEAVPKLSLDEAIRESLLRDAEEKVIAYFAPLKGKGRISERLH